MMGLQKKNNGRGKTRLLNILIHKKIIEFRMGKKEGGTSYLYTTTFHEIFSSS